MLGVIFFLYPLKWKSTVKLCTPRKRIPIVKTEKPLIVSRVGKYGYRPSVPVNLQMNGTLSNSLTRRSGETLSQKHPDKSSNIPGPHKLLHNLKKTL